jgi:alpha-L-rhamnosidase
MFRRLAGIDAETPGFETISIRPILDPRVKRGGGDYDSVLGRISTDWNQTADNRLTLAVRIPPNALAHIYIPAAPNFIKESRTSLSARRDMRIISQSNRQTVVEVGSGNYSFSAVLA